MRGGEISVSAENNRKLVRVSASDTGNGMSREDMSKLFRIEKSFKSVGTAGERGTGLGLIYARNLWKNREGISGLKAKKGAEQHLPSACQISNLKFET